MPRKQTCERNSIKQNALSPLVVLIRKIFHCDVCLMKAVVFVCLFVSSLGTGI